MKNKLIIGRYILLLVCSFILGCSRIGTLNLNKHRFGLTPTKIIWLQIAGLSEEHIAMLRFAYPSSTQKTSFEMASCVGQTWGYNLYDIRPNAYAGFLSQLVGKKNIKNSCEDYENKSIWAYLSENRYQSGIFEVGAGDNNSLLQSLNCKGREDFLSQSIVWEMDKSKNEKDQLFHLSEGTPFKTGQIYYDRSCQTKGCYSSLHGNIKSVFERFSRGGRYLFLLRDFSYLKAIEERRIGDAREVLREIDKILEYFYNLADSRQDVLVLLTSSESLKLDFPAKGEEWKIFERSGQKLKFGKSSLVAPVFVKGARAENFCGFYEEVSIFSRIFSEAKYQGLELGFFN